VILEEELSEVAQTTEVIAISQWFDSRAVSLRRKSVVYVTLSDANRAVRNQKKSFDGSFSVMLRGNPRGLKKPKKKALKEEEELLRVPLHNLQEIETNTVFSDRVMSLRRGSFFRGLPRLELFFFSA